MGFMGTDCDGLLDMVWSHITFGNRHLVICFDLRTYTPWSHFRSFTFSFVDSTYTYLLLMPLFLGAPELVQCFYISDPGHLWMT